MTSRAQPVSAVPGQTYGQRKAQEDAQRAAPMAGTGAASPGPPTGATPVPAPVPRPNIFGPTERPSEPLTAGAALGPGPSQPGMLPDDGLDAMRAIVINGWDSTGAVARMLEREASRLR